ncbi:MAG: hypothetical protein OSA93_18360 [Akkermansiaceae bacterium]|jgi:hypothetical protein|nr:hypothetical protein [Akkermansiaceae bacterium]
MRFVLKSPNWGNPLSPPAAPVQGRLQGPPAKSKFLAVVNQRSIKSLAIAGFLLCAPFATSIEIVLDFTLDEQNHNWFNPSSPEGAARRTSAESAAAFLSAIIENDDWAVLPSLDESFSIRTLAAGVINDLDGNPIIGTPERDIGYEYDIPTTNRSGVAANQYIIYVGAFPFDSSSSAHAWGGWVSNDRRNAAGSAGTEFNTWGGKIYFDISASRTWYSGQNPGADPTDDYGIQDPDKSPSSDISSDNWDWHMTERKRVWRGFHLRSVDPAAVSTTDLYGVTIHELLHALGLTKQNFKSYIGTDGSGDAIGAHLVAEYGGPVPLSGGHFDFDTQSEVWDSAGIISETTLDPSSTRGNRKYLTKLDAAALRDLGYDVATAWASPEIEGLSGVNFKVIRELPNGDVLVAFDVVAGHHYTLQVTTNLTDWVDVSAGSAVSDTRLTIATPPVAGDSVFWRIGVR